MESASSIQPMVDPYQAASEVKARANLERRIVEALHGGGWGTVIEQWFMGHRGPRIGDDEVNRIVMIYLGCIARDVADVLVTDGLGGTDA